MHIFFMTFICSFSFALLRRTSLFALLLMSLCIFSFTIRVQFTFRFPYFPVVVLSHFFVSANGLLNADGALSCTTTNLDICWLDGAITSSQSTSANALIIRILVAFGIKHHLNIIYHITTYYLIHVWPYITFGVCVQIVWKKQPYTHRIMLWLSLFSAVVGF